MLNIDILKDVLGEKELKDLSNFLDLVSKEKLDPDVVREETMKLVENVGSSYFKLAAYLYLIAKEGWYLRWGYSSFKEYVLNELSFRVRKAQYLISIWHWYFVQMSNLEVLKKVLPLGWSKMAVLVGVVDSQNVDKWVEIAKNKTVEELKELIRAEKEAKEPRKLLRKSFLLQGEDADAVESALKVVKKDNENISDSKALSLVCLHFLGSYLVGDEEWILRDLLVRWEQKGYKFLVYKDNREVYKSLHFLADKKDS